MSGSLPLSSSAARRPSSPWPGGIWMSTTATSGRYASVLRTRSTASPAWATTSNPASASNRAMPSRSRTSSSPITTRAGVDTASPYSYGGLRTTTRLRHLVELQQSPQRRVGKLVLRNEGGRAVAARFDAGGSVTISRDQHHGRPPGKRGEFIRAVDPLTIRQPDVGE